MKVDSTGNNSVPYSSVPGFILDPTNETKVVLQPPPQWITYKSVVGNFSQAGVYLIDDNETEGLLTTLGFKTPNQKSEFFGNGLKGYGTSYNEWNVNQTVPIITQYKAFISYNLSSVNTLYFCITNLNSNGFSNSPKLDAANVIASIGVTVPYGSSIIYSPTKDMFHYVENLDHTDLQIVIFDQDLNIVNFNGQPWSAVLTFNFNSNALYATREFENRGNNNMVPFQENWSKARLANSNEPNRYGGLKRQFWNKE